MHVGQTSANSVVVIGEPFVVDAQQMQYRGMKIVPMCRLFDRSHANLVGGTVGHSPFETAARHHHRKSVLVVIAPGSELIGILLGKWCSAKFRGDQQQRVVEKAALS